MWGRRNRGKRGGGIQHAIGQQYLPSEGTTRADIEISVSTIRGFCSVSALKLQIVSTKAATTPASLPAVAPIDLGDHPDSAQSTLVGARSDWLIVW